MLSTHSPPPGILSKGVNQAASGVSPVHCLPWKDRTGQEVFHASYKAGGFSFQLCYVHKDPHYKGCEYFVHK